MTNELDLTRRSILDDARKRIGDAISEAHAKNSKDEEVSDDSVFTTTVLDWLTEKSIIQLPSKPTQDEYFTEHRYNGQLSRGKQRTIIVNCWGSAVLKTPGEDDQVRYDVHFFLTDYVKTNDFRELTADEFNNLNKQLLNFYKYACNGNLEHVMNPQHPAFKYVGIIRNLHERNEISSVRFWILSNAIFTGNERNSRISKNGEEWSSQLVDLSYIAEMLSSTGIEVDQSFERINGLEGIRIEADAEQDYDCILTVIPGETLASLYSLHGPALVRANVRAYLGGKVAVNKGIQNTILNEPSRFLAYNNGLVVSCRAADFHDGRLWKLQGIQIINGGQTTASIHQAWLAAKNNRQNSDAITRLETNIKKLLVPMKVVISREGATETERAKFRVRISEAANSQNAVRRSDLEANSPFQVKFAEMVSGMITSDGHSCWFYENARGLYAAEKAKYKDRHELARFSSRFSERKKFDKTQLAMAYLACEGRAQDCAKGKEVAFGIFSKEIDYLYEQQKLTLDEKKVQEFVSRWILFSTLEKRLERKLKNPRVTTLYTLAVLHEKFGTRIQWERIWQRQGITEGFLSALENIGMEVDAVIRSNMGHSMINMYGRRPECIKVVQENVMFDETKFEKIYELTSNPQ